MPPNLVTLSNAAPLARMSMLLWGEAGCGKTFFANTAPGKRLIINLDPDGYQSLPKSEDTLLLDVSNESNNYLMDQSKTTDPFNIKALIQQNPDISTVIVDSVTKYSERAVSYAIGKAPGSTHENPGPGAYGYRNRLTLNMVSAMLIATGTLTKHIIFICHEDVPTKDKEGAVVSMTILLGGSLPVEVPLQISEVWHMRDTGQDRRIIIRSAGLRKPMKSRMFDTSTGIEFTSSTVKDPSRVRLDKLIEQWYANKLQQLKVPQ